MSNAVVAKTNTGEIQLTITIPWTDVNKAYQEAVDELAAKTEIAGFRKGKAPRELIEEKTDKNKIYEQIIQKILPEVYLEAVKKNNLKPIISPRVELLKAKEGEDWEVRATTAEKPNFDLGDYKNVIRQSLGAAKLWTPGQKAEDAQKTDTEEKMQKAIETLISQVKIEIPQILIEEELNRSLAHLLEQTEKLGLTLEQYLASVNKTVEIIRKEYQEKVKKDLKLLFILEEIAKLEEIKATDEEIEGIIKSVGDEKVDSGDPLQKEYLGGIIRRRKVLEMLANLS